LSVETITVVAGKRLILGVTGSIAAYKAADLASKLTQAGALVDVIMTDAARQFIAPLAFQAVTGRPVYTSMWAADSSGGLPTHIAHVGLGEGADLLVIAPCTAQTLARLAHGLADDLLSVTALAARCPLLLAPAMDGGMYAHPAVQANLETLRARGVAVIEPDEGRFASGLVGRGRLPETPALMGHIRQALARAGALAGRRVIVTAGGTSEPIDPVRYVTNRSSGRQGYALAQAALDAGADVTLISAARGLPAPVGAVVVSVETAREMLDPTADILAEVRQARQAGGFPRVVVGFAAESENLLANARAKLERKGLDLLVANDITAPDAGFAVETNRVTILDAEGGQQPLELMSKAHVAEIVVERAAALLRQF
jgi:phosphopantothenoylcysteine decarboxylase/phosphopantothenate--cysteine ligase